MKYDIMIQQKTVQNKLHIRFTNQVN